MFDLIALKLHAIRQSPMTREWRDLDDIARLISVNNIDVGTEEFKELCLQYGTPDIYKKISDFFGRKPDGKT